MKKFLSITLLFFILIFSGCEKSLINLVLQNDPDAISMFGKIPSRSFFVNTDITDSLKLVWENSTYGSFNNSSAVVYDSILFINDLGGRIHCFDIRTGKQKGVLKTKGAVYSTPLLFRNRIVYALCDQNKNYSNLIYYDLLNGKELFDIYIEGRILSQMINENGNIILCKDNGTIKKYSAAGKMIWETETSSQIQCNPAMQNNKIVVGNNEGEILFINSDDGKIILRKKVGKQFLSGVTIDGDIAYIADNSGVLYAIDINNGNIIWQFDTGSRILMNPAVDDENVFVGNLKGNLYCIDKNIGELKWQSKLGGLLNSTPLITKNRVVITNLNLAFYIIDKKDGIIKNKIELEGRGKLSPILINNKIIIGYDDGNISAYEIIR